MNLVDQALIGAEIFTSLTSLYVGRYFAFFLFAVILSGGAFFWILLKIGIKEKIARATTLVAIVLGLVCGFGQTHVNLDDEQSLRLLSGLKQRSEIHYQFVAREYLMRGELDIFSVAEAANKAESEIFLRETRLAISEQLADLEQKLLPSGALPTNGQTL